MLKPNAAVPAQPSAAPRRTAIPCARRRAYGTAAMASSLCVAISLGLTACAGMNRTMPSPGDPVATVVAKFGEPSALFTDADDSQILEYAFGPMGQQTWMARFTPDGHLRAFEQVLTGKSFATIKVGVATETDVLRAIGHPAERSYLALPDLAVWSYRYKENDVWNSMMHVHFNRAGVVKMMQNGPDPMYEEKRFFRD